MSGASFKGNLEVLNLSDIFQSLAMNRHSGTLIISDGKREKKIYFAEGEIQLLSSSRRMKLGELLIATGKISDDDLDLALKLQKQNRKKLGEILVEEGFCQEEDIARIVKFQIEEEIYDLFLWRKAEFEFIADHVPDDMKRDSSNLMRLALNTNSLIMEALRRLDEWELVKQAVPSTKEIFLVTDPGKLEEIDLPERLRNEIHLIDGKTNVEGLAEKTMVSEFELCKLLAELVHKGAIRALATEELVQRAEESYAVNDFSAAASLYGRLAELAPGEPKVLIPLAESLRRSGDDRQALAIFEEIARKLDPQRDAERLRRCYETIVALDPDRADVVRKLSEMDARAQARRSKGAFVPAVVAVLVLGGVAAVFHKQIKEALTGSSLAAKHQQDEKLAEELLKELSFAKSGKNYQRWHELAVKIWTDYPATKACKNVALPVVIRTEPPGFAISVNNFAMGITTAQEPIVIGTYTTDVDKVSIEVRKPATKGATTIGEPLVEPKVLDPKKWPGEVVFKIEDKSQLTCFPDSPIDVEFAWHPGAKAWVAPGRDAVLYVLHEADGTLKRDSGWGEQNGVGLFGDGFSGLTIVGDKAYLGATYGGVSVIDLAQKRVQTGLFPVDGGSVRGRPLVVSRLDRVVFATTQGHVYFYPLAGGRTPRFKAETDGAITFAGTLGDDQGETVVFVSSDERLRSFDVATGKLAWSKPCVVGLPTAPPVRSNDVIFVANADGELLAVQAKTGKLRETGGRWRDPNGRKFRFVLNDAGDRIFVGTEDGHVRALDAKTLAPIWSQDHVRQGARVLEVAWQSAAGAVANTVLVAFDDPHVIGLDPVTGNVTWQGTLDTGAAVSPFTVQGDSFLVTTPTTVHLFRRN